MTYTKPRDFQEFWNITPKPIRENCWFFPIQQDRKNPDVPSGTILKGNISHRLSYGDSLSRLKWGKNVGIYALQGGLMFLDLDVKYGKFLASQGILDTLESNPTFTIQTRNGGIQKYFQNEGKFPNQVIKENNIPIGELRTGRGLNWMYVVSVGSYVNQDEHVRAGNGTYTISGKCRSIEKFKGLECCISKGQLLQDKTKIMRYEDKDVVPSSEYFTQLKMKNKIRRKYVF